MRVPLLCMVGASNELPESEELDALYDRFLFRFPVQQVSVGGLRALLELVPTTEVAAESGGSGVQLTADALAAVRSVAYKSVVIPPKARARAAAAAAAAARPHCSFVGLRQEEASPSRAPYGGSPDRRPHDRAARVRPG